MTYWPLPDWNDSGTLAHELEKYFDDDAVSTVQADTWSQVAASLEGWNEDGSYKTWGYTPPPAKDVITWLLSVSTTSRRSLDERHTLKSLGWIFTTALAQYSRITRQKEKDIPSRMILELWEIQNSLNELLTLLDDGEILSDDLLWKKKLTDAVLELMARIEEDLHTLNEKIPKLSLDDTSS